MELRDDGARRLVRTAPLSAGAQLALIALVCTVVRLVFAGTIHLTEDEAYYRLWALHLQAGYLDHPPMIAWWIRAGMTLAGDNALGVRLLPVLATGLATWLLGDTALRLGLGERIASRAALWWNATLLIALGGLLATPDTPACFFWALSVWCLSRVRTHGAWWLAAGAAAGLCCLSKYSGLFLAPGALLWLAVTPSGLAQLRRPWPWLAALVAVVVFLPNVMWNAGHGWLTFDKQFGRAAAHALRLSLLPEFLFTTFVLLNPFIAVLAARGAWTLWPVRREPRSPDVLLPLATVVPFLLYLLLHSLHDRVQAHWPAPTFGGLALAAAYAAERSRRWLRIVAPGLGFAVGGLALAHLALPSPGAFGVFDPAQALRHWRGFATDVETMRRQQGAAWVGVESYGVLAQLAAERRSAAPMVQIIERERYFDWDHAADLRGPGLVLDLDRRIRAADLKRCFSTVTPAGSIDRGGESGPATRYTAFRVEGPKYDLHAQGCPWKA